MQPATSRLTQPPAVTNRKQYASAQTVQTAIIKGRLLADTKARD